MIETLSIFAAAVLILAIMCAVSRYRRHKRAEDAAMKCLTMTDASRRVC